MKLHVLGKQDDNDPGASGMTDYDSPIIYTMTVIEQDFSDETSLFVYCLKSGKVTDNVPERVIEVLRKKGFTRIHQIFLYTPNGKPTVLPEDIFIIWLGGIRKIFFNYGDPAHDEKEMTAIRIEQEKEKIKRIAPDAVFYHFGNLTPEGNPKSLDDITDDDAENKFNGGRQ
jgi:hypothetical protein